MSRDIFLQKVGRNGKSQVWWSKNSQVGGKRPSLRSGEQPTTREKIMGNSKNAARKTARMPATKFSHLQKKLKKGKTPPESKKRNKP